MGGDTNLVKMANDIANFFRSEPVHEDAVVGIANHIAKFWTPRMREKLESYLAQHGNAGLDDLPREAIERLRTDPIAAAKPKEPPGGDAG